MFAAENRADDVRRQYRETEQPRRIGRNDALGFGNILEGQASIREKLYRGLRWRGREDAQGRCRELRAPTRRRR